MSAWPGRGAVLDEGVVIRDVGRPGVALRGGEEHDPEGVAGAEAGGNQAPVLGHFGSSAGAGDVGGGSGAGGVDGGDAVVARVAGGEAGVGVGGGCGAGVGDEIGPGRSAVGGDLDPVAADGGAAVAGGGGLGQVDLGRPVGRGGQAGGSARGGGRDGGVAGDRKVGEGGNVVASLVLEGVTVVAGGGVGIAHCDHLSHLDRAVEDEPDSLRVAAHRKALPVTSKETSPTLTVQTLAGGKFSSRSSSKNRST